MASPVPLPRRPESIVAASAQVAQFHPLTTRVKSCTLVHKSLCAGLPSVQPTTTMFQATNTIARLSERADTMHAEADTMRPKADSMRPQTDTKDAQEDASQRSHLRGAPSFPASCNPTPAILSTNNKIRTSNRTNQRRRRTLHPAPHLLFPFPLSIHHSAFRFALPLPLSAFPLRTP